jgi:adenylylsulfate kinase-like enzyme
LWEKFWCQRHSLFGFESSRDDRVYVVLEKGEIPNFTGISDPYEHPEKPEMVIETNKLTIEESVKAMLEYISNKGLLQETFLSSLNMAG